jgi:hypothetical protein
LKFFKLVQDGKFPLDNIPILSSRLIKETFCRSAVKFPSSLVKRLRQIGVETRLKRLNILKLKEIFLINLMDNIAFELFLDIVEWFDKDESHQMRYSLTTLQFLRMVVGL